MSEIDKSKRLEKQLEAVMWRSFDLEHELVELQELVEGDLKEKVFLSRQDIKEVHNKELNRIDGWVSAEVKVIKKEGGAGV